LRVLLVEDHHEIAAAIAIMLKRRNYAVVRAENGHAGLALLCDGGFDLAIVDIVLPGLDGFAVCEGARRAGVDVPILILTARDSIADRVRGLDAGADDYLIKPFYEEELAARLRTLGRRARIAPAQQLIFGELIVDLGARCVSARGRVVPLAPTEFRIVELLARNKGFVLERHVILERVWGGEFEGESNIVDVYMSAIRRKFKETGLSFALRTVRGSGYRFDG